MDFGEAIPIPLDTADGFTVGRDDLTPPGLIGLIGQKLTCMSFSQGKRFLLMASIFIRI